MERPDPDADRQEQMEVDEAMETMDRQEAEEEDADAPSVTTKGQTPEGVPGRPVAKGATEHAGAAQLGNLLMKGAEFLSALGQTLAQSSHPPHKVLEKHLETMVGKDEMTGKSYLKIPHPRAGSARRASSLLWADCWQACLRKSRGDGGDGHEPRADRRNTYPHSAA